MSFEEDLKNWLNPIKNLGRSIRFEPSIGGVRVILCEDWDSVAFSTGEPSKAFKDALKYFESNKIRLLKEKLQRKIEILEKKEKEIQEEKEEINRLKKYIKDKTLATFESINNV